MQEALAFHLTVCQVKATKKLMWSVSYQITILKTNCLSTRLTAEGGKHTSASMFDFMVKVILVFIAKLPKFSA